MDYFKQTKELCRIYGVVPNRSKGQNFLVDEKIYDQVVEAADLRPDDTVLEVGPGFGFLTAKLAKHVKKVIAVELDDKLAKALETGLKAHGIENVEVKNENILEVRSDGYKIVANLPYNITSHFLRKFLSEDDLRPPSMVLMLQKEVAERICAKPGKMSLLSVSVQYYANPEIVGYASKRAFWPMPDVDSAIVKLSSYAKASEDKEVRSNLPDGKAGKAEVSEREFFRLVKFGFSARRKMLKNNLAAGYYIEQKKAGELIVKAGFSEKIRAQELTVEDWLTLVKELNSL